MDKKIEDLEKKVTLLEEKCKCLESSKTKQKKQSAPRKPSAFNEFMKKKIKEIKTENPNIKHSDAWNEATKLWSKEKEVKDQK